MKTIVTHTQPDFDAIGGAWLLLRYWWPQASLNFRFVNTGNPDREVLAQADAVVDTGKAYDPDKMRFDHHQLPGGESNATCATRMVYEWLYLWCEDKTKELDAIKPLVDLIFAGDTGRPEANESRMIGIHAALSGEIARLREKYGHDTATIDYGIMRYGLCLLDNIGGRLVRQAETRQNLSKVVTWKSEDNRLWAIQNGKTADTFAAFDEGTELVVFVAEPIETESGFTYPVGISRAMESSTDTGALVNRAIGITLTDTPVNDELKSWYMHPAGFFSGRGTGKAPDMRKPVVSAEELAKVIESVWSRT